MKESNPITPDYREDLIDHVLAKCPLVGPDGTLVDPCIGSSSREQLAHQN